MVSAISTHLHLTVATHSFSGSTLLPHSKATSSRVAGWRTKSRPCCIVTTYTSSRPERNSRNLSGKK